LKQKFRCLRAFSSNGYDNFLKPILYYIPPSSDPVFDRLSRHRQVLSGQRSFFPLQEL
jgi:hypothetical protein